MKDYYEILEVHPKASIEVIKKAYRVLAVKYHPDITILDKDVAKRKMTELNEAYAVLSNAKKRADYDATFVKYDHTRTGTKTEDNGKFYSTDTYAKTKKNINKAQQEFMSVCESYVAKICNLNSYTEKDCEKIYSDFSEAIYGSFRILIVEGSITGSVLRVYFLVISSLAEMFHNCENDERALEILKLVEQFVKCGDASYDEMQKLYSKLSKKEKSGKKTVIDKIFKFALCGLIVLCGGLCIVGRNVDGTVNGNSKRYNIFDKMMGKDAEKGKKTVFNFDELDKVAGVDKKVFNVVTGYDRTKPIKNVQGNCELTIDNSQNSEDIYLRVWDISVSESVPVRAIYLKANEVFTMRKFNAGTYELRYKTLSTNGRQYACKSQSFNLEDDGERYSVMRITLYRVRNGNFHTHGISVDDI